MCCCDKPNVNGTPGYSWDGRAVGTYPVSPPALRERDELLMDEPGRCGGLDSHSHHYRLVSACGLQLLVRHGGGDERVYISLPNGRNGSGGALDALLALDSDARYWFLNALYHAHADGRQDGAERASRAHREAFADGRLRKRKMRGCDSVKVWIEPVKVTT